MKDKSFGTFLILWLGQFVSSIGSGLTAFGLGVYVFQQTQSATAVSMVTLSTFLPIILLAPVGGVLADRFDRRLMMLIGDGGAVIGLAYLLFLLATGEAALWQICASVAFSSLFASLTEPAYRASISDLLTEEFFAKASGMVQLAGAAKFLISPVVAGLLLRVMDVEMLILMDISTIIVTFLTITAVRRSFGAKPAQAGQQNKAQVKKRDGASNKEKSRPIIQMAQELREGWQLVVSNRGVLMLMLLLTAITFYMGFLETLYTPMVLPLSDEQTLGIVQSVSATGLLLGSLFIGLFSKSSRYVRMLSVGLLIAGLFFSLIGMSPNVWLIAGAGFLFFAAMPFVNTGADVLIRKNIPNEAQGRAWGIIGVISQLGYVLAYASAGPLADHVFNPLLEENGSLASTVGQLIGTGPGRGIGLLFMVAGVSVIGLGFVVARMKSVIQLEKQAAADEIKLADDSMVPGV
ncbi:macrolide transporter [Paenibacillus oryzae]|uniref:Macrolide transporter n=1 Tax=Paenibacillus oryzae TaxID=1844972 RepID=A0A1A5YU74_9BACL|nr:MFS transporter [Paenibacillus oryzae]OBR68950.1 macrolide transporter [Paenibacillus oryzae]